MLKINLIGNLGADAEVRHLDNGQSVISFNAAHSEKWTDKNGQKQEKTEWIRCSLWRQSDKIAIAQYLKKGVKVYVEGKPSAKSYSSNTGETISYVEVNVSNLELLSAIEQPQQPQQQNPNMIPVQNQNARPYGNAVQQPNVNVAQPNVNVAQPHQQPNVATNGNDDDDELPF